VIDYQTTNLSNHIKMNELNKNIKGLIDEYIELIRYKLGNDLFYETHRIVYKRVYVDIERIINSTVIIDWEDE